MQELGDGANIGTANGAIALDCSVRPVRNHPHLFSISTTDFFFPLVDSPYVQGRIGAANVLSDLYAEGVSETDFVLMLLAASRDMEPAQRTICTRELIRGFRDACVLAGTAVTGGQTVLNPWPIVGGVATSVVADTEFIRSDGAQVGNVLVLTKPLGTQIAVNVHEWKKDPSHKLWTKTVNVLGGTDKATEQAAEMLHQAICSMARLNRNGALLMQKYKATAATDVTGFGILGHVQNLTENQVAEVGMELDVLPMIAGTKLVNDEVFNFRLTVGYSAETSGGLLICLPDDDAANAFIAEIQTLDGAPAWKVGRVTADPHRKARIMDTASFPEV